jgi:hypothetical protein
VRNARGTDACLDHTRSGVSTENSWFCRFGATGSECFESVVVRNCFAFAPTIARADVLQVILVHFRGVLVDKRRELSDAVENDLYGRRLRSEALTNIGEYAHLAHGIWIV